MIKHAIDDYKKLNKQKLTHNKIWEQIRKKYEIPMLFIQDFSIPQSPADRALDWAKREMQIRDSNEHLRNRVLRQARKEVKKLRARKTIEVIVDVVLDENKEVKVSIFIDPKDKNKTEKLRFTAPDPESIPW